MDPILSKDVKKELKKEFKSLTGDVSIMVFTRKGRNDQFNEFALTVCKEFSELSDKIHYQQLDGKSEEATRHKLTSSPEILFNPDRYDIRFMGAPLGEEGRSFVATIMMVSTGKGVLAEASLERIRGLKDPREIMVFVTPT